MFIFLMSNCLQWHDKHQHQSGSEAQILLSISVLNAVDVSCLSVILLEFLIPTVK